jgi:hypothetical protein
MMPRRQRSGTGPWAKQSAGQRLHEDGGTARADRADDRASPAGAASPAGGEIARRRAPALAASSKREKSPAVRSSEVHLPKYPVRGQGLWSDGVRGLGARGTPSGPTNQTFEVRGGSCGKLAVSAPTSPRRNSGKTPEGDGGRYLYEPPLPTRLILKIVSTQDVGGVSLSPTRSPYTGPRAG